MAYNPGITDRSGEILAQGTAAAAQMRMQGYQNATNSLLKGFSDLNKKQQEEEVKRNETLAKFKSDPSLAAKLSEKGNEDLKAKFDKLNTPTDGFWAGLAGRGDKADSELLSKFATGTQEATVRGYQAEEAARQGKAAGFLEADAKRKADLNTREQSFRDRFNANYNRGEKTLRDYNTYAGIQESLRNINAPSTIGAGAIPQTTGPASGMDRPQSVFGSQVPQALPGFDARMSPSASGLNGSVPPALSRFEPAPMQINAPQSVFGLDQSKVRQAPPSAEFDTPEKINELLYNYTPGSNSAMQRSREYGDALTPAIMQGENQIQAAMDSAAATNARAQAVAANTEMRRREAAIQQAREEARAIRQLNIAEAAEGRAVETAKRPPTATDQLGRQVGGELKGEEEAIDRELMGNPDAMNVVREMTKNNNYVRKEDVEGMTAYIKGLKVSDGLKNRLLGSMRK